VRRWQVDLFGQYEFRVRSNLQLTFGARVGLNRLPSDFGNSVLRGYDYSHLVTQAEKVKEERCVAGLFAAPCRSLIDSLKAAFPADFRETFGHDRVGNDGRFGFVWDPGVRGGTVVRGGFGVYTGTFPIIVVTETRVLFPGFLSLDLTAPKEEFGFNPFSPALFSGRLAPGSMSVLSRDPKEDPTLSAVRLLADELASLLSG
jgi:hypothetical protein